MRFRRERKEIEDTKKELCSILQAVRGQKSKEVQKHDEFTDCVKKEAMTNSVCTLSANVAPALLPFKVTLLADMRTL